MLEKIEKAIQNDRVIEALVEELVELKKHQKFDQRNNAIRKDVIIRQVLDKLLTDEERASYYNLPEGCRMRENAKIISPEKLICGEYVWIGESAVLDASGGLEIGNHTSIGLTVFVWSHTSYLANLTMSNYSKSPLISRTKTKIGNGVFIGGPSVIYPGVELGDKTVVLPNSTVTKSFEGNSIIGGSPAKLIRKIEDDEIKKLAGG